jgi:multisubunit Na+/H+ antiporter MnhF subunit
MNLWLWAAGALSAGLGMCGFAVLRGTAAQRLAALGLAQVTGVSLFMLLAQATANPSCMDLALVQALLSLPSGLVLAQYLGRWL